MKTVNKKRVENLKIRSWRIPKETGYLRCLEVCKFYQHYQHEDAVAEEQQWPSATGIL
jgi:hypothetical protein